MNFNGSEAFVLWLLIVATASLCGLLAVGISRGTASWLLRLAALGAMAALAAAVSAFDALLAVLVQSAVVIIPFALVHGESRPASNQSADSDETGRLRRNRWRFSLADLMSATVVVSVVLALAVSVNLRPWEVRAAIVLGWGFGTITLAATWVGLGRGWPVARWGLMLSVAALVGVALRHVRPVFELGETSFITWHEPKARWIWLTLASGVCMAVWLRLWHVIRDRRGRGWRFVAAWAAFAVLSLGIVAPTCALYVRLISTAPPPVVELPEPNGFDEFVKAAEGFSKVDMPMIETASEAELQDFLAQHDHLLTTARKGLARECRAPFDVSSDRDAWEDRGSLRDVAWAFALEGRLAELQGDAAGAVRSFLDLARYGQTATRGASHLYRLQGTSWSHFRGELALRDLRNALSADECREVIRELEHVDRTREPFEASQARDVLREQFANGWQGKLSVSLAALSGDLEDLRRMAASVSKVANARTRLVICHLAIRAYEAEHDRLPQTLTELYPGFVAEVPVDPFSGRPMVYRPRGGQYLLYSVFHNGVDDGGRRRVNGKITGDLLLEKDPSAADANSDSETNPAPLGAAKPLDSA